MKKFIFIIFITHSLTVNLTSAETEVNWPLHKTNIIKINNNSWSDKFFSFSNNQLFVYYQQSDKTVFKVLQTLSMAPQYARYFPLRDAEVITVWNNNQKKLEILIFDKNNKLLSQENIKLTDQVDDLQIRIGQGRRPALLFIKKNKNDNMASVYFDDREQIIFRQSTQIMASTLDWSNLSAYIVTKEGTKPVIKVWKKGIVNNYEIPFSPIFAQFVEINDKVYLLAIDSKSTLWSIVFENFKINANKILYMKDLPFVRQFNLISLNGNLSLIMHSPFNKKLFLLKSASFTRNNNPANIDAYLLLDSNQVFPGKISENFSWLESSSANYTYLNNTQNKISPIVNLNWKVNTKAGYPEILVYWDNLPANKKYEYRYIMDTNPDSLPLPEYRIKENRLTVKLLDQGNYYLHIQARDLIDGSESVVYHFPVSWKYRPIQPNIYLTNEISPYVITGNSVIFIISNVEPLEYYAEINNIPVYDPVEQIYSGTGEVQIDQRFKPGRYYLHIRAKDPKTNSFSTTLHYLFFYQTYVTEFSVGTAEYNSDIGKLNSLIDQYKNAQSIEEKNKILRELDLLKKSLEDEITK
ncbi:MAG: hypothetical protein OEV78_07850 [Spirochaetia bacterium]|nr:hypothetical protein [Spirochaetia bacterium]